MNKRALIALAIILTGVSVYLFDSFYKEARNIAITKLNEEQTIHAKQAARGIEDFFTRWTYSLNSLSKMDAIIANDAVGKRYIRLFYEANEGRIKSIARVDERGVILYHFPSIRPLGTDISDQKHIRELLRERKPVISDVSRAVEGFESVALHVPVFRGGVFKGSIGILIDFEGLAKRYLDVIKIGETGYAWIISRDGTLLYSPVSGTTGKSVFKNIKDYPSLVAMVNDMLKGHAGTATYTYDKIGNRNVGQTKKFAVYMPIQIGNSFWSIAVASAEEDVLSGLVSFRNKLALVIGALFICGMAFSTMGAKAWLIVKEEEKRELAEKQLEDRLRFEKLLTGISTKFINISIDQLDTGIKAAQQEICEYLGVDICTLWQFSPDRPEDLMMTHIYVPPHIPFESPETLDARDSFPWCLEMMLRKEVIVLSRITDAPAAAARDLESWEHYGIKSALTFPLFAGNGPSFGALGFNTLKEEHDWPEELINSLEIVSQIFASALSRKFAEKNLRESETRLRLAAASANAGVWSWDYKTGRIWVAGNTRSLYGFPPDEEITADTFFNVLHPDDLERVSRIAEQAFRNGAVVQTEYRIMLPDKATRWIAARAQAFFNASGEPGNMTGVSLDITERKLAETALEESRTQIAAVMSSTRDFIWSVDPERFGLLTWNRAFSDYFLEQRGIRLEVGMTPAELVPPDYVPLWHGFFSRALREEFVVTEYVVVAQTRTLLLSLQTMRRDNVAFGISVFGRDITELKRAEEARLEGMERYRAVVEAFDGFIYICSQDYHMEFMNQRLIERTGRNAVGEMCYRALHNSDSVCEWCVNDRVFQGETVRWEVQSPKDHRWYYVVNTPIRHADGTMSKQSMIMDITEKKQAEESLRETEQRFRRMADAAPVLIWMSGTDKLCTYFNLQWLVFTGRTLEEELGNGWTEGVHPEDHERCLTVYTAAFDRREPFSMEYRLRRADGEYRWVYDTGTPHISPAGDFQGYIGSCIDITGHKQAEEALKESEASLRSSQKDLRKLAGKLISAQEDELRRLSRELHDDLTQRLAVTAIEAGKLELELNKMQHVPPDPVQKISQIKEQLIKVSEDVHQISRQLHPTILDDLGLVRAIESECAALMRRENIEIIFRTEDVPDVIANDIALCLYRVVQEGLRNVMMHSCAEICEIVLKGAGNTLCLAVSDDGVGFDPGEVRQKPGLGLSSMRERAQLVQGDFSIKSRPGQGAVIRICVPLNGGDA